MIIFTLLDTHAFFVVGNPHLNNTRKKEETLIRNPVTLHKIAL